MAIKYRIREETLRSGNRMFYVEYKPYFLGWWKPVTEYVSGYNNYWPDVKRSTLEEAKKFVTQQKLKDAEKEAQRKAIEIVKVKYYK